MEFTGKSVEEAIETGLKELGIARENAVITVVEEPIKGLFGKIKKEAVVKVEKKTAAVKGGNGLDNAVEFLKKVTEIMGITARVTLNEGEENPVITVLTDDSSAVIGYRGEVLDSMQTLAGAIANIGNKEYKKVVVDCENYRTRREDTLIALAHKLEGKATEMRRIVLLEPMSPFERRIIHTALADSTTVKTSSDGNEPNRYVVITPNDLDETARPYNAGANRGRNDRGHGGKGGRNDRSGKFGRRGNDRNFKSRGRNDRGAARPEEKRKTPSVFGTYLGNSLKDKQ